VTVPVDRTLMKGSKRNALSIALLLIGAAALYNWILSPQVGYLRAVQRYQPVVNEMAEETERIGKTLDKKRQKLRTMQGELARTRDSLFTPAQAKAFLGSLESFVGQTGCKVIAANFSSESQSGQPREAKERAPVTASHVDLTLTGQYDQIIALVKQLQGNPKKIWVDSCGLKLADMRSGRLECRLALTLHALSKEEGRVHE
jgi:hypothetical protein